MALSVIGIITLTVMACKKDQEVFDLVTQIEHATRGQEVFDLSAVNLPGTEYTITRTLNPNVWYVHNQYGAYNGRKNKWKFVPVLTNIEISNAIEQYEMVHPDDLTLPEPPHDAIHSWKFSTAVPCTITMQNETFTQPHLPCPRACE